MSRRHGLPWELRKTCGSLHGLLPLDAFEEFHDLRDHLDDPGRGVRNSLRVLCCSGTITPCSKSTESQVRADISLGRAPVYRRKNIALRNRRACRGRLGEFAAYGLSASRDRGPDELAELFIRHGPARFARSLGNAKERIGRNEPLPGCPIERPLHDLDDRRPRPVGLPLPSCHRATG